MDKKIIRLIKPLYKHKDSMHNFKHILRIKKRVHIYKKYYINIDNEKLDFIIYFHGLGRYVKEHEKDLIKMGFDKKYFLSLYRHTKNPKSIEEKLVSDANLWESVGKFGIKKSLQVGKERNQNINETLDIMRRNIKKIKFYTKKGKELGNPGINIVKNFLKDN